MKKHCVVCVLLIFCLAPVFSKTYLNGTVHNISSISAGKDSFNFTNALQLQAKVQYKGENWRLYSDTKLSAYYGFKDYVSLFPDTFIFKTNEKNFALGLDLDRLYVKINAPFASFTIGRDYLSFGTPFVFNTLEWYKDFLLLDPTAIKPAINLFAINIPIGSYGKFEAFIGGDNDWNKPLVGSEFVFGTSRFEGGFAYQYKNDYTHVIGSFFKADIFLTLIANYSLHVNNVIFEKDNYALSHEASIGLEYSFPIGYSSMLISQSFYYNSIGAISTKDYSNVRRQDAYFSAISYSYTSLNVSIDEFTSVGANVIVNFIDGSGSVLPQANVVIFDGLDLNIGFGINFGKVGSEFFLINESPQITGMIKLSATF